MIESIMSLDCNSNNLLTILFLTQEPGGICSIQLNYVPNTDKEMRVEAAQGTTFLVIGTAKVTPPANMLYIPDLKSNVEVWYKSGIIFDRASKNSN